MSDAAEKNLHSTVGRAGVWVAIRQVSVRGLTILQLLLLARILSPADFGLFAVAMMVYAFIEAMTFLGFGHALIQRKTVEPIVLDTLFVVNMVRGVVLAALVWAVSASVAWLMNAPESQPLITAIGLLPLIMGFHNPAMILFQKELRMKQELSFHLAGALANLGISLVLALQGGGAWALIFGMLGQSVAQLAVSYTIQAFRPRMQFSKVAFLEMFDFGKWLLASQGLKYFSNNLPSWVIGHYLGVQALGVYHVSGRFSQAIGNEFAALVSIVAFPAFSKMQSDTTRLAAAYLRSQKIILSASFMLFGCMIALAGPFVSVFLGYEWIGAENLIVLLSLVGVIQSIGAQAEIMKALNGPNVIAKFSFMRLTMVAGLIIFTTKSWGSEGAVVAILLPTLILLPFVMAIILHRLSIPVRTFIKDAAPPLLSLVCLSLLPWGLTGAVINSFISFVLALFVCMIIYLVALLSMDKVLHTNIVYEWRLILAGMAKRSSAASP